MVIHEDEGGILCIGQAAHAWASGQMAMQWGTRAFAQPDPFADVCLAAQQHDIGMAEWDARPQLNAGKQRPLSFMEMPTETHVALWRAAAPKVLTQSPYAALLISMHGSALYEGRDDPLSAAFRAEQDAFQAGLIRRLNASPERARRNQRLLWALDYLSIAPLAGWLKQTGKVAAPTKPGEPDATLTVTQQATTITVDPWPFSVPELEIAHWGRRLTEPATSQRQLDEQLAGASWEQLTLTWRPRK